MLPNQNRSKSKNQVFRFRYHVQTDEPQLTVIQIQIYESKKNELLATKPCFACAPPFCKLPIVAGIGWLSGYTHAVRLPVPRIGPYGCRGVPAA